MVFEPNWIKQVETGTTHGTPYNYDTHVPLIWFGKGISTGSTVRRVEITDIAVTLSHLYNINLPNAAIGNPIEELFYK